MDLKSKFSVTGVRQFTSDASTFLTRAVQVRIFGVDAMLYAIVNENS